MEVAGKQPLLSTQRAALTMLQACWCLLTVLKAVTYTVLELVQ